MDIPRSRFQYEAVQIIEHISKAHFVAFDLELSGIAHRRKMPNNGKRQKLTLQEFYDDTKEAANKYQVIQLGLAIVQEDKQSGLRILDRRIVQCD